MSIEELINIEGIQFGGKEIVVQDCSGREPVAVFDEWWSDLASLSDEDEEQPWFCELSVTWIYADGDKLTIEVC